MKTEPFSHKISVRNRELLVSVFFYLNQALLKLALKRKEKIYILITSRFEPLKNEA